MAQNTAFFSQVLLEGKIERDLDEKRRILFPEKLYDTLISRAQYLLAADPNIIFEYSPGEKNYYFSAGDARIVGIGGLEESLGRAQVVNSLEQDTLGRLINMFYIVCSDGQLKLYNNLDFIIEAGEIEKRADFIEPVRLIADIRHKRLLFPAKIFAYLGSPKKIALEGMESHYVISKIE